MRQVYSYHPGEGTEMSAGVFCDLVHPVDSREVDLFGQMRM